MNYAILLLFVIVPSLIIAHVNYKKLKKQGKPYALKIGCFSLVVSILGMSIAIYFLFFIMFTLGGFSR